MQAKIKTLMPEVFQKMFPTQGFTRECLALQIHAEAAAAF